MSQLHSDMGVDCSIQLLHWVAHDKMHFEDLGVLMTMANFVADQLSCI